VVGEVNGAVQSAAVGFFVKTGSRDESAEINGVSHFLEHMLFKGTQRLSAFEVNEAFDKTGAQFNASTSEENTVFYAAVLPEYLVEVTQLWIELMRPALRDEDFDIEKQVIKEEIAMYKDLPHYDVMERCRSRYFGGHPCGNSVLGTEEAIDGLAAEQMRGYFGRRYAPNNMVAVFAGNFDWEQVSEVVKRGCSQWQKREAGRELGGYRGAGGRERASKANLVREHIGLMSAAVSAQDQRRYTAALLSVIVGDSVGSRFFWELVDKAIAETASMQYAPMDGTGAFYSYIRCGVANADRAMKMTERIFGEIVEQGISADELAKARNKVLSAMVIKNELPMGRLVDLGASWVYLGQYRPIEEEVEAVKAVTVDDVNSLAKEYDLREYTEYRLEPEGD